MVALGVVSSACAGVLGIDPGTADTDGAAQDARGSERDDAPAGTDQAAMDQATAEDAAPGGDATASSDTGGGTGPDAPAGTDAACPGGAKSCAGQCVSVADPAFGCTLVGCQPCAAVPNGAATCTGTTCGHACSAGYVDCAGLLCSCGGVDRCLSDNTCGPCRSVLAPCNLGTDCCSGNCGASLTCL